MKLIPCYVRDLDSTDSHPGLLCLFARVPVEGESVHLGTDHLKVRRVTHCPIRVKESNRPYQDRIAQPVATIEVVFG